jgi:GNAT superfamily N-acetyltransferase
MVLDDTQQLTDQWLATWTRIRGITATQLDGCPLVHVASASRETELVCVDPGVDRFVDLLRHVQHDPRAMLTVAAPDVRPYRAASLPAGVRLDRDDETLMSTRLAVHAASMVEQTLTPRWDVEEHRATYTLESGRSVAASGTVGVLDRVATFDSIETLPAFRRRGLGRHVMAALTTYATDLGATHGVLAASGPGRGLYTSLGWEPRLQMLSLMGQ